MAGREFFSPDYLTSRRRFRELASARGAELEAHALRTAGPDGEPLTIDVAWFGPRDAKRIVAVTSATHGVEGFMGGAAQLCLLEDLPTWQDGTAFVLIHAVNPYGFAYVRRVNEDNADLNRNFLLEGEAYEGAPDGYAALDGFLNPQRPPNRLSPYALPLKAAGPLLRQGMGKLKTIVAGGQYAFPKGVFFGGAKKSNTVEILEVQVPRWFGHAEHVIVVDFHTGLGDAGTYKLLVDHDSDAPRTAWLKEHFGADEVQPWDAGEGVAYSIRGGLGMWFKSQLPGAEADVLACEFGTVNPIQVITALSTENRAHHWGEPGSASTRAAKQRLMDAFVPSDPAWRDIVVQRGRAVVETALAHI